MVVYGKMVVDCVYGKMVFLIDSFKFEKTLSCLKVQVILYVCDSVSKDLFSFHVSCLPDDVLRRIAI